MAHHHSIFAADSIDEQPQIRHITIHDLRDVLARGVDDFAAMPSHAIFLCLIYPVVGFVLIGLAFGYQVLPLAYPLVAGFALIGPFAALGLYEMSRRRERGLDVTASHAADVFRSPSIGAIALLGLALLVIFVAWIEVAQAMYQVAFGHYAPASATVFVREMLTTSAGWQLIVVGNLVGFVFALVVLVISAVSFPLLLDRDVGAAEAVLTSLRAIAANPGPMAVWGVIVAVLLAAGALPLLFGLAVVVPILGHATWHLYRKVVEP